MCLYKNHWLPKISCKPKYVYKVVYYTKSEEKTVMHSAFRGTVIEPDTLIKASKSWIRSLFTKNIKGEGVHAYKRKSAAVHTRCCFSITSWSHIYSNTPQEFIGFAVVNAIIPPYTFYWENKYDGDEIAATKMIILNSTNNG